MGWNETTAMIIIVVLVSCMVSIEAITRTKQSLSAGIDLGTTFSLVSVVKNGKPFILSDENDNRLLPSVVRFEPSGRAIVGKLATEHYKDNVQNTFHSFKRLIGRDLDSAKKTKDISIFGKAKLTALGDANNKESKLCALNVPALNKVLLPEELSAEVLRVLLKRASDFYGGQPVENAVITVPAYFDPNQRKATERAGFLAGLKKVKLLKEPEAAAMAYGLLSHTPRLVLVIDLGGGTLDVSVLEVGDGLVEVIATSGDGHLGGDDFDNALVDWILDESGAFTEAEAVEVKQQPRFLRELTDASCAAKISLSKQPSKGSSIIFSHPINKQIVDISLSRRKFDSLMQPLLARMLRPIREVAIMAGINLPGESGSLGMKESGYEESVTGVSMEEGVGAPSEASLRTLARFQQDSRTHARQRNKAEGQVKKEIRRLQRERSDSSLTAFPGGQIIDDVILVGGASRMPCVVNLVRTLTGIDPKRSISPDEAICMGAGILAGVLDGTIDGFRVLSPLQSAILRLNKDDQMRIRQLSTSDDNAEQKFTPNLLDNKPTASSIHKRLSSTKIRIVTEEDEDVREYLLKQQRLAAKRPKTTN